MAKDLKDLLKQAEELIVAGRAPEAAKVLTKIEAGKLPRAEIVRASKLFRWVGAADQGLRLLLPIVRPKARLLQEATPQEKAECAITLQRLGSLEEACELLEEVDENVVPEALLYRTVFRFSEWDYRGGIAHLLRLTTLAPKDSYLYRLAQLNLASAFVYEEKYTEAETLLHELRNTTSEKGEQVLFCNALEISAQVAVFTGNLKRADECLTEAEKVLAGAKTLDKLWLVKWRAILSAYQNNDVKELNAARAEAIAKRHWETLRELDFVTCKIKPDENILRRLYFGTQFDGYRRRLARNFALPTQTHAAVHKDSIYKEAKGKDLKMFADLDGDLKPGELPHLLLVLLISDAYRSLRSGQLHSRLFPGDYFNPYSSLDRVHQIVKRTRKALDKQIPGLEITHDDGVYRLDFSKLSRSIEIPLEFPKLSTLDIKLYTFLDATKKEQFKSEDVQKAFALSESAANRLISAWRQHGAIEVAQKTRPPLYAVKKSA